MSILCSYPYTYDELALVFWEDASWKWDIVSLDQVVSYDYSYSKDHVYYIKQPRYDGKKPYTLRQGTVFEISGCDYELKEIAIAEVDRRFQEDEMEGRAKYLEVRMDPVLNRRREENLIALLKGETKAFITKCLEGQDEREEIIHLIFANASDAKGQ